MKEFENGVYRLNRAFNIFNPKVYIAVFIYTAMLIFAGVCFISMGTVEIDSYVVPAAVTDLLLLITLALHCPKCLTINEGSFRFEEYINMRPKHNFGR